jgi:hypothetical protein
MTSMTNGPSFCWQCLGDLKLDAVGAPIFALVRDPLLNDHRVHLVCVSDAIGDGYTEVPTETRGVP